MKKTIKKNIDEEKIKSLQTQIFDEKEKLSKLGKKLEKEYPQYAHRKKEWQILEIEKVKKHLSGDGMLLDYFVGDSAIYVFKISKRKF